MWKGGEAVIVPILSIAVGLILIVILIVYNLRSLSSTPKRSERQYPIVRAEEDLAKPESSDDASASAAAPKHARPSAKTESMEPQSEGISVTDDSSVLESTDSGQTRRAPDDRKMADRDYRQALQKFRQPDQRESSKKDSDHTAMKDDDFRAALRSMMNDRSEKP